MNDDALIYTRISSDRSGEGVGVARQEKEWRALAERRGWNVVAVFSDNDVSAYSGKARPGYEAMMRMIASGRVRHLIAWHQDRLHRNTRELEDFIDIIEAGSVMVETVNGGSHDFRTPNGRMYARMSGVVARNASEQASERIKSKFREKAAAGEYSGGVRPFGYDADGVTVRPDEAETIRQATREILAGGSLRDIARRLNDEGVTSSRGKPWSPNQVKAMVMRARNAGLREHQGEVVGQAVWPAIVDEADWRSVRAVLMDPSRRTTTTNVRKYLLSGIARCGECGGVIIAKWVSSRQSKRLVYECRYSHCVARAMQHVDALVERTVVARLSREDAREVFEVTDEQPFNFEFDELHGRMDQAAQAFASGAITVQQLETITKACRDRLGEIQPVSQPSVVADLVSSGDVQAVWENLSLARKRAVIDALLTVSIRRTGRRGPGFDSKSVVIDWR